MIAQILVQANISSSALSLAVLGVFLIIIGFFMITGVVIASMWKTFEKAGEDG